MYESGGEIHWGGHLLILLGLLCISAVSAAARWNENLMALPFLLYLAFFLYRTGKRIIQVLRSLFRKTR